MKISTPTHATGRAHPREPAASWDWFVDPTPWDGLEIRPTDQGEQNRMDLLTVIAHELGHLLGYEHEADGVMAATLAAGERQIPGFDFWAEWEQALYALAAEGR